MMKIYFFLFFKIKVVIRKFKVRYVIWVCGLRYVFISIVLVWIYLLSFIKYREYRDIINDISGRSSLDLNYGRRFRINVCFLINKLGKKKSENF